MQKFVNNLLPGWLFEENYGFSDLGKIWILWHPSVKLVILKKTLQMISCEVWLPDAQESIIATFVYGSNCVETRSALWLDLIEAANSSSVAGKAWIVLGDFNQTIDPSEHSSPSSLNCDSQMRELSQCLLEAELHDLNFRGTIFTWWNKQKSAPIAKKLDRVLVNEEWATLFPDSVAFFGDPDFSDHAVASVLLNPETPRVKKPFKFYNFHHQNPEFVDLVSSEWL